MRISGGDSRGIGLKVPAGARPTSEKVRQAVFSSLAVHVPDARVLDLYCGSGALGLEALSRGAERATFVDSNSKAMAVVRENATKAGLADRAQYRRRSVDAYLDRDAARDGPFDLVFADPPYADGRAADEVIRALTSVIADDGRFVAEVSKRHETGAHPGWILEADRHYGDTRILVWRPDTGRA